MPIQKVTRGGATAYKVQIRRRGFPSVFRTFERYGDAKAFEDRSLREQESRAAYGCNVNLTLGQVIDAYLASEEYAKLRSNRKGYHEHWRARLGTQKLTSLNRNVYQHEADLLGKGGRRPRSRATVASFMSALGTTLKYATRKLAADSRALAEFRCCTFSVRSGVRGRALEPEEVRRLVAAADVAQWPHWGLLVRLALTTAARKGELLKRRRRDVDLDAGTITVPVSKNGHPKVMIVLGEALDMLRARCEALEPDDLLFPGRLKTSPLDPKKSWPKLVKKADLPADCTFHWLRKTTATRLLRAGVDVASVAAVTGHRTHAVLLRHYASAGEARQREVVTQHVGLLLGLPAVSTPATVG
jgi:integrase